jgi:thioredoxin-like negative regulator of GroEL
VAFEDGDLEDAREAFEKALELKREEPDFYLALRKVYLAQGKLVEARSLLREANELLALNAEIYRPSSSRLRLLERESELNNSVESARRILITR